MKMKVRSLAIISLFVSATFAVKPFALGQGAPPAITSQPLSAVVTAGQAVSLNVVNSGTGPFGYQWLKEGAILSGQTNSTLNFSSFQFTNSGSYHVVIKNSYGMAISFPAILSVSNAPLRGWGMQHQYGQLGDGTLTDALLPILITNDVVAAAAGATHTLFVKADGTLWAIGYNGSDNGDFGTGATYDSTNQPVMVTNNVIGVAAGDNDSFYLTTDGTLWAAGIDILGQLGDGTSGSGNAKPLATVIASNAVTVAAGYQHTLYLTADGTLWGMGWNNYGQLGNGTTIDVTNGPVVISSNVVSVAAGYQHTLYLTADGTLWAMGYNRWGQLGSGTTNNAKLPIAITNNVVAVAAGCNHSLFITMDGTLRAMGYNSNGQLGNGTYNSSSNATPIIVTNNVVSVVAGYSASVFAKADGTLWSMGAGGKGALGIGTSPTRSVVPVQVNNGGVMAAILAKGSSAGYGNTDFSLVIMGVAPVVGGLSDQSVNLGQPASFTVSVSAGDAPFAYQWLLNGTNILDATNATYSIASAALTDAGNYTVVVSDSSSSATANAALNVTATLAIQSDHGTANPVVGLYTNDPGSILTTTVASPDQQGTTQYVCSGWSMTGNEPASGTTTQCVMTLTNNAALTWLWTTNYWLAVATNGNGTVDPVSGWQAAGSNVTMTANSGTSWHFAGWSGDTNGCVISGNTITVEMAQALNITANFNPDGAPGTNILTLDNIQFWTGTGTNRAAMVIEWSSPEVFNNTDLPAPVANQSMAWGFRWNGNATAEDMFNAILANDSRLFAAVGITGSNLSIFGLGYDLNNNRVLGIRNGTNILAYSSFTNAPAGIVNGLAVINSGDADAFQPLDPTDLYWGGLNGPNWELWTEPQGNGGFTHAPVRGTNTYWTPDDPQNPWTGNDGQWRYAEAGISDIVLKDGSWIGWSVAAGGLDFTDPAGPGTIAWGVHKHAPTPPIAAPNYQSPYAVELTATNPPFGPPALYNDPSCVLGQPSTLMLNSDPGAGYAPFHIKIVEPAYNTDIDNNKAIVTLPKSRVNGTYAYGSLTVRFDHPVYDNPANPYGIDFEVFGNAFYVGSGFVSDVSDMRTYNLVGGCFAEPMLVSVSPDGTNWYTYNSGPYCDTAFPTQGFEWDPDLHDKTGNGWTRKQMDFTKPVNPELSNILGAAGVTMPTYNALKLYVGSGGGTGFDLKESGFQWIQYVRVSATDGYSDGEVDAFSIIRPAVLGEELCVTPGNITNGTAALFFQDPGNPATNAAQLQFVELSDLARASVSRYQDRKALSQAPGKLVQADQINVVNAIDSSVVEFNATAAINIASQYTGNGVNLFAFARNNAQWTRVAFSFDAQTKNATFSGISTSTILAFVQVDGPELTAQRDVEGVKISFLPVANWTHTLERTVDFKNWTTVSSVAPTDGQTVTITDTQAPQSTAFYRLQLDHP